ncbi:MAG: tetratricopeptide repeat protein [Desulfobacterales bacterium]|nr:MAG: tetratricopeptide repeat protein [Desulfobacterales bacterium]
MGEDEEATVRTLTAYREVLITLIQQHNGKVLDSPGDNLLAEFASVVDAVQCAVAVQKEIKARNDELPENRRMQFRIGINLGDVIQEEERIYGDGVNIAARLEGLANPGGICISKTAFDHIESKLPYGYEFLGDQTVKNIAKPVGVYRVMLDPRVTVSGKPLDIKHAAIRRMPVLVGAVVVLALVVGIWQYYLRRPSVEPASVEKMAYQLPDEPSIAVLPFVNMSDDPKQEYLSDGITESIITALSNVRNMFVISRNSTFTYKGKPVKIKQVAEELGVRYVLEGSIQKTEDRLRITAQLIDALTGKHLWAQRYDRNLKDLFALQDEITMKIVTVLRVKLTEGEHLSLDTDNLDAYLKYLQARKQSQRKNKEGNALAQKLIEEAIALDPEYATAYLILSATHLMDIQYGLSESPKQSLQTAEELVKKAISLSGVNADAHAFLGRIHLTKRQYDEAIAEGKLAVEMAPNSSFVHAALAYSLKNAGRPEEAITLYKKAIRLSPFSDSWYFSDLGHCYGMLDRYEDAILAFKKAISISPESPYYHSYLAANYFLTRREKKAQAEIAKVMEIDPKFSSEACRTGELYKDEDYLNRLIDAMRKAGLPERPPLIMPDKPSIAVLPFDNMSGDPEQEYFCNGIADQIINSIAKIPYIMVIARNSSFAYKGKSVNVQQIARDLGVRYILEGSLQRDNENVRINAQLIDAETGGHLWAENYDRKLDDIFSVQDEICKSIMVALQVKLTTGEQARMGAETVSIKAYEKYLKAGEHYIYRTKEDNLVARQLYQEAIALDPEYAMAYLQVGWTYLDDIYLGMTKTPSESIARAEAMVQKAISIHGLTSGENALLSNIHLLKKDWEKAIAYGEKAVEQSPNSAGFQNMLGYALRQNGQYDEAISRTKKALQLNPVRPISYLGGLGWAYLYSKQYEKAISTWNETLERNPDYLFAYLGLTGAYWLAGSENQARQAAQHVLRINPKFSVGYWEKRATLRDKALKEQLFDIWRKAGLK